MISVPTLLLDVDKCKKNIMDMRLKAQKHNLDFRPHFKTHQSLEIGKWFKEAGVDKITVSSLEMAAYFSKEWEDITVAFPANILEIERINELAKNIQLNLLIASVETATYLQEHLTSATGFFIKIDAGYHRTGIIPADTETIDAILKVADSSALLSFKGFLAHSGHTYKCRNKTDILKIHAECMRVLIQLKNKYKESYPEMILSLGDTPSCSVADNFEGIDEIRPGNFVFYDLTQNLIGACDINQIAVAVACPIVAIHKDRNEVVIYGGGVHFSKERLENEKEGTIYGRVVAKKGNLWSDIIPDVYIKSLSQEHGIVAVSPSQINNYTIGDYLIALPIHSCMTANLMKRYSVGDVMDIAMMNSW